MDKHRDEYPMLNHWVFFNAADQMVAGRYWLNAMRESLNLYEAGRAEDDPPFGPVTHPFLTTVFNEVNSRAAKLIHAKENEVTNMYRVMTASNLILNDLMDLKKGDNVVFSDLDYPSIPFILLNLQKKGVELRRIGNVKGEILMGDMEKAIDEHTKVVILNRTTPWAGFTYDVRAVSQIAHEHGALVLDDAIQAVGAIDVDVHKDDVDFLITGSYKWQGGPEGSGIFYIREDLIDQFEPSFRNYIWADLPDGIPFGFPDHDNLKHWDSPLVRNANKFNLGESVSPVLFGWNATLKFYEKVGIKNIESEVRSLGDYAIDRLKEIGCRVYTPEDREKRHGLVKYTTGDPSLDLKTFNRFNNPPAGEKPVKVSLRALGGIDGIRVSCHFFNTKDEIDTLVETQERLMHQEHVLA
ncbi:hypothetical protein IX51_06630 [uncultured archaeon]|nr:hypothetical protein IX51_06630 [uncultured archaeon]